MRRTTANLITLSKITTSSTPNSRNFTTQFTATNPIKNQPTTCPKSRGLLLNSYKFHNYSKNPCQNFTTKVEIPPNLASRAQIEATFEKAETAEEMLKAFKEMEANFDEGDLGLACVKIGLQLLGEGGDAEKIMSFASRAKAIFDVEGTNSLACVMSLQLLGCSNFILKKFGDAFGYHNRAIEMLGRLEEEGSCDAQDIKQVLYTVQVQLAKTTSEMGRWVEALENYRKAVEIKGGLFGEDSLDVGNANRDLVAACVAILKFKDALPCCLKALEIHVAQLGENSVEVAHDRRLLRIIYTGMGEHEKALEQNQLAQKVLRSLGLGPDFLRAEIDAANIHMALGRYEVAVDTLKGVVKQTEEDSKIRALVFITSAKALVSQAKLRAAKRCLQLACGILDKKETMKSSEVSETYMEISKQYEIMKEFENAISVLKRALALLEKLPQELHSKGIVSSRIGRLLLLTGKVSQAIPYLESAAKTLKESFGSKHFGVAYICNDLGAAYLEMERPQSAAQMFAVAKDIMDVELGRHHTDAIEVCQNLSKAYTAMESYALAIEFQQKAVDAWQVHGQSEEDELREAHRLLEQLKMKDSGAPSKYFPRKAVLLPNNRSLGLQPSHPGNVRQ